MAFIFNYCYVACLFPAGGLDTVLEVKHFVSAADHKACHSLTLRKPDE